LKSLVAWVAALLLAGALGACAGAAPQATPAPSASPSPTFAPPPLSPSPTAVPAAPTPSPPPYEGEDLEEEAETGGATGTPDCQGSLHLADITGDIGTDPYGRPLLRAYVLVHGADHRPLGNVAVTATIRWPGGSAERTRVTKQNGRARFHWGTNASGTWELCADELVLEGCPHQEADDDVPRCQTWSNAP
jgi:hypothetical protein